MNEHGVWREKGFEDFRDGTFGNAGQNVYVSKKGVLQRIHHFDINRNGYVDLLFVNSQDNNERPPVSVYADPLNGSEPLQLPSNGSFAGALADLNGDGFQDLVIAMQASGVQGLTDLNAYIYHGAPEGLSERYRIELPAPNCLAVAVGDFNGDGRPDIAFAGRHKLRIFYQQPHGFQFTQYTDLDIGALSMVAADLDGDGCAELYARDERRAFILWGGPRGLDVQRIREIDGLDAGGEASAFRSTTTAGRIEALDTWKPRVLTLHGRPHLFACAGDETLLIPVLSDRRFGEPLRLATGPVLSAALGDIDGDGYPDLVLAAQQQAGEGEVSWIYWGGADGFKKERRTSFDTCRARDAVPADLDGDGRDEIIVCQGRNDLMYSVDSLIYRCASDRVCCEPVRLPAHDPTAVLVGRTSAAPLPQAIFINRSTGCTRADIPVYLYYGGPDGYRADRREELVGWAAPDALCCDFNDDGRADILLANCSENAPQLDPGSFIYWQDENGFDPARKTVLPTWHAHGVACADLNRNGYLDLVAVGFSNPEILIFSGGPGGFDIEHPQRIRMEKDGLVHDQPRWLLLADLNNNGWLDLAVPLIRSDRSFILWGGPEGFSMERSSALFIESAGCMRAADLTGNGYLDLVIGTYHSRADGFLQKPEHFESFAAIYWNGPEGFREDRKMLLPAHAATSLAIADFNNDGILDIYVASYHGVRTRDLDSHIYWGGPRGHYSMERRTRLFTHSASGCLAADFNEDGWVDLAVANHKTYGSHPGPSMIWWNGPEGFSEQRVSWLPTNGPHGMLAVEPGNIMDRSPEEYYASNPHVLPGPARPANLAWDADLPPKTWVRGQVRCEDSREALEQAPWQGAAGPDSWLENGQPISAAPAGRWLQYRLALGARNGGCTPRLTEVRLAYTRV